MTNESLKNCPFCNGIPFIDWIIAERDKDSDRFLIICNNCVSQTNTFLYRQDAIDTWNTRAPIKECECCDNIDKWTRHANTTPIIAANYKKAIEIIKRAASNSCCICCDSCLACDATELLREIGEFK